MMKRVFLTIVLVFGFSAAHAGFLIEPNVGFAVQGGWDFSVVDDDVTMTHLGSRIGYMTPMGLMFGGDVQYGTGTYKTLGTGFTTDLDGTSLDLGAFVGFQSMIGFRGYISYMAASSIDLDDTSSTKFTGTGFKLGAGYQIVEYFALNLEYHMMSYTDFEDNTSSGSLGNDFEVNLIMINASFPINFI